MSALGVAGVVDVDHIGLAVRSIAECLPLYLDVLGGTFVEGGDVDGEFRTAQILLPGRFKIELLEPLDPAGKLASFLSQRGPGLHHVAVRCADVSASADALTANGQRVIGISLSDLGWREAYLHPGDTGGLLIQLFDSAVVRSTGGSPAVERGYDIGDVLAGRLQWLSGEFVFRSAPAG